MRRMPFMILFLISFVIISGNAFSQEEIKKQEEVKNKKELVKAEEGPLNTVCPVSTEPSDPEFTYKYKGKTYAVCCNSCLKKFKNDPEKYISRLSEDGKSIVKSKKKEE